MRKYLIAIAIELFCSGSVHAQTGYCTVSGYLVNSNGSPAAQVKVDVINVVTNGSAFVLTPIILATDPMGFVSFAAPRLSIVWIGAAALGQTGSGDVAILIPDADSAALSVLGQSAKPPVSGFSLTTGSNPTLALSLQDFGIKVSTADTPPPTTVQSFNGRSGAVTLASGDISAALNFTPLDPSTVVGAVNASTAHINDARLSADVVLSDIPNVFSSQQTLTGLPLTFDKGSATAITQYMVFKADEVGAGDFAMGINSVANVFNTARRDQVFKWGYNQGATGKINSAEHSFNYDIESYFAQAPNASSTEAHLIYVNRAGTAYRPMAVHIDLGSDTITTNFTADRFSVTTGDGVERLAVAGADFQLENSSGLRSTTNNVPFLRQINAERTQNPVLVFLDNQDSVVLGDGNVANLRWAGTGLFAFGPYISSGFPALKANGATLAVRTATNSADAPFSASVVTATTGFVGNITGNVTGDVTGSVTGGINVSASIVGTEIAADPMPPAVNGWKLYAKDDGTGKSQLCVEFATGLAQCFARQP